MHKLTKKLTTLFAVAALALAFGACKKDEKKEGEAPAADPKATEAEPKAETPEPTPEPTPAAGGEMTVDEAGEAMLALITKMETIVNEKGEDCAAVGTALMEIQPEFAELMAKGEAFDADEAKKKEFDEKYGEQMMEKMGAVFPALEKCKDDPNVVKFMESLN